MLKVLNNKHWKCFGKIAEADNAVFQILPGRLCAEADKKLASKYLAQGIFYQKR